MRRRRSWTRQFSYSPKAPPLLLLICLSIFYSLGVLTLSNVALAPSTPFLAALLFTTLHLNVYEGFCIALILGFISDTAIGVPFRVFSLCYPVAFSITRLIQLPLNLPPWSKILPLALIFVPSLGICEWLIYKFLAYQVPSFFRWLFEEGILLNFYDACLIFVFVCLPQFILQKMGWLEVKEKKSL